MVLGRLYASTARVSYAEGLYRCNSQPASCSWQGCSQDDALPCQHCAKPVKFIQSKGQCRVCGTAGCTARRSNLRSDC